MPEQKPSSRIISRSYSVRWRIRWASSIRPSASKRATCSSSSARSSSTARSIVGFEVTYSVAGQMTRLSSFAYTSPVSGSKWVICSTSSPKNETRYAVSMFAGCTSTTSPFTRKRPRPSTVSLRTYWLSTSFCRTASRSCSSPTSMISTRSRHSSGEPRP